MGDYEDEDLPSISVNTANDSDSFVMPDAHILATERAEEAAHEEEIKRLRADDSAEKDPEIANGLLRRTDSSSSEGEGTLAATLHGLRVAPAPTVQPDLHPADVLLEFTNVMPSPIANFLYDLSIFLRTAGPNFEAMLDDVLNMIEDVTLTSPTGWDDVILGGACAACAAATQRSEDPRARARVRQARRLLHHLLDNIATPYQIDRIAAEWAQLPEPTLVALARVTRGASGRGGARVAQSLNARAIKIVLKESKQSLSFHGVLSAQSLLKLVTDSWRGLSVKDQHKAVPLIGQALRNNQEEDSRAGADTARARLLSTLAKPMVGADRNHPNRLKVLVGVSRLQLLYRNKC